MAALEEDGTPWFYFDPIYFLPLWIGIWRWAAYLILKMVPSLLYKPIPISDDIAEGEIEVNTAMMTMIIPVYMPEPGFEECLQSWVDNRPKTIVVVVDTNSYQQVRSMPNGPHLFSFVIGSVRSSLSQKYATLNQRKIVLRTMYLRIGCQYAEQHGMLRKSMRSDFSLISRLSTTKL